jgi:hypothetical protein
MLYSFFIPSSLRAQNNDANHIVFENLSGRAALVKLVGTSSQAVSVPNGERRAVAAKVSYLLGGLSSLARAFLFSSH